MAVLLIVDDEPNLLYSLKKAFESPGLEVATAETAGDGIRLLEERQPDAVILDVRLPDMSGLDAFVEMHRIDPRVPVIIVTAFSTSETAIEAMKRGAYEYLLKPVELDRLRDVVERALAISRMSRVPAMFDDRDEPAEGDRIVGRSPGMQEVYKGIGRVAPQDVTVLILGESGTGKEMVARAIYQHSRRSQQPFLAINCAAIPDSLLESELFGHERGAFTGAERRRIGKFEQVDGGTLFLDEIGDMPTAAQARMLRLLQEGSFERVGSNETLHVDVRVIAATNQDLEHLVAEGRFRRDLFYRLKVVSIELPPLRSRSGDVPLLVEHFIRTYQRSLGRSVRSVSPEAMEVLLAHDWPGNVRELQSAVKHAILHAAGETITAEGLPESCRGLAAPDLRASAAAWGVAADEGLADVARLTRQWLEGREPDLYHKVHAEVDRVLLRLVLDELGGNQAQASQVLGISRTTLRARITELGLAFEKRLRFETPNRPREEASSQD